jgi:hypothetical protein
LREAIVATLDALAAGKITPKELPIDPATNTKLIRYAPGFGGSPPAGSVGQHPYTSQGIATFLGEIKTNTRGEASEDFRGTFNALELLASDNGLEEKDVAGLEVWKIAAKCAATVKRKVCTQKFKPSFGTVMVLTIKKPHQCVTSRFCAMAGHCTGALASQY